MTLDANKTLRITYNLHLGNVRATVTDLRQGLWNQGELSSQTSLASAFDYYPFGMIMPGRSFNADKYRFGFGGMEKDDEVSGTGATYDFGGDSYDARIGRRKGPDPEWKKGPGISPYSTFFNNPILYNDTKGKWPLSSHYLMTRDALIEVGFSKKIAKEIAHFSAVYADNPNPNKTKSGAAIIKFNQTMGANYLVPPSELNYKDELIDYSATSYSQSDEDIRGASIHATRTWWEDITPKQAIDRALNGGVFKNLEGNEVVIEGAYNVINRLKGIKEENLTEQNKKDFGLALHTIQDVDAHRGGRFIFEHSEEAEKKGYKNEHSVKRDLFGSLTKSMKATRDALKK